jgi:hypothetical protein
MEIGLVGPTLLGTAGWFAAAPVHWRGSFSRIEPVAQYRQCDDGQYPASELVAMEPAEGRHETSPTRQRHKDRCAANGTRQRQSKPLQPRCHESLSYISTSGEPHSISSSSSKIKGNCAIRSACQNPSARRPGYRAARQRRFGSMSPLDSYPPRPDVSRLQFIRRARDFGLSIEQLRELLRLPPTDSAGCSTARQIIQQRLDEIREKQTELIRLENSLVRMARRCDQTCGPSAAQPCTIFEDLRTAAR